MRKKILSVVCVLLTVVLSVGASITAFAAENSDITAVRCRYCGSYDTVHYRTDDYPEYGIWIEEETREDGRTYSRTCYFTDEYYLCQVCNETTVKRVHHYSPWEDTTNG